jgi:hypothetical protein
MRADEGDDVLGRDAGAVLALDVTQDRRLVGEVIILERVNRLQDHLQAPNQSPDGHRTEKRKIKLDRHGKREQRRELPQGRNGKGAGSELTRDRHDPSPARDAASRRCSTADISIEVWWRRRRRTV